MLSKEEKDLAEKVVTGGGTTGQSMTADATGSVAQAPGNSKKQGDSMEKGQNPGNTPIEDTDTDNNTKSTGDNSAKNKSSVSMKASAASSSTGSMKEEIEYVEESVKAAKTAAKEAHAKGMSAEDADRHIFHAVVSANKGKSEGAGGMATRARINSATDAGLSHFKKLSGTTSESVNYVEELSNLFGDDVSESFIVEASTLFEAAVALKVDEIEQSYAATLDAEVASIKEELKSQVDQYLTFAAEEWVKTNEVAIETSLKNELTEEFIEGLKNLFAEHYMEVPSDKVDVLETLASKVEELEARLNETVNESIQLKKDLSRYEMQEAFDEVSEGLALTQVEKFRTIAENLEFGGNIENFKNKLEVVKEQYFNEKKAVTSNILTEEFENGDDSSTTHVVNGEMGRYVTAISRSLKK
jgi:hypothetical protein